MLRAFSSGCAALTGVEAISNGVPGVQEAEEQERRHDPAAPGRVCRSSMISSIIALASCDRRQDRRRPGDPAAARRAAGRRLLRAAPRRSASSSDVGLRELPDRRRLRLDRHRPDPRPRGQHGVQRLPGARLDPRARRLPAAAAAHPRRPARLLQRHPHPRRRRHRCSSSSSRPRSPRSSSSTSSASSCRSRLSQIGMVRHWTRHLRLERNPKERAPGCSARASSTPSVP